MDISNNLDISYGIDISDNVDTSNRVNNKILWTNKPPAIHVALSKISTISQNKSHINHYNMPDKIDNVVPGADWDYIKCESCSDYCNMIDVVSKMIFVMENKQFNHSNPIRFRSKNYSDKIVENNCNVGNEVGNKDL